MNVLPDSLSEVFDRFSAFERDGDLFSREVCGVRFWHYARFGVYSTLVLPHFVPMDAAHPDMHIKVVRKNGFAGRAVSRIRRELRFLRMLTFENPSFALKRRDVLISLAPRTTSLSDGRRIRLAVDFFLGELKSSWCVLELPVGVTGYPPNDGPGRTFKWEAAKRAIAEFRASRTFRELQPAIEAESKKLAREISEWFGIDADETVLRRRIASAVILERAAVPLLRKWLRRLGVKCVVEVVHYASANMALTRAAHEEGLPVVELQHGTIISHHAAYNLPENDSPNRPDYLLGWGDYWIGQTKNFPLRAAQSAGYPYLENFLSDRTRPALSGNGSRCTIVYVSQGTVGRALSESAARLRKLLPQDGFSVLYKLHPNEMKTWRSLYPGLEGSGVEVLDDPQRSIYDIFNGVDVAVGSYSTALVEGFLWGIPAFVLRGLPGSDLMESFSGSGMLVYVDRTEDVADALRSGRWKALRFSGGQDSLWRTGSVRAIANFIDRIVEKGDCQ